MPGKQLDDTPAASLGTPAIHQPLRATRSTKTSNGPSCLSARKHTTQKISNEQIIPCSHRVTLLQKKKKKKLQKTDNHHSRRACPLNPSTQTRCACNPRPKPHQGEGLLGNPTFALDPLASSTYTLFYSPLRVQSHSGSVTFSADAVGQFWYRLDLRADPCPPVK